jgi:hypothetical protein
VSGFSPARRISILFSGQFSKIKSGSSLKGAFMPRIQWPLYILLALLTVVVGCESEDDSDSSTSGSVIPGVIDANGGFNVKINNPTNTDHYIHKAGDFTAECSVASNETNFANQDITCIVEIEELAGANTGVKMVLNSPPGMCKYVWHRPYFYYGLDYGVGPTAATVRFDTGGTYVGGSVSGGPGSIKSDGTVVCGYDYSALQGPDCCTGTYSKTTVSNFGSTDPDLPQTSTTETVSWTGKPGNCAAGSGVATAPLNDDGIPMGVFHYGGSGFNKEFETAPRSVIDGDSSLFYANYYSGTAPAAFKLASTTYRANPYYTWICYDDAEEIVARIRVQIREWNETSEFDLGSTGDPDTTSTEPNWGAIINDYDDWLDVFTNGDLFPGMPE